ncbi:MAG: hypothetical protein AB7E08_02880 [Candidatus Omnitrophota bacterium]
MTENYISPEKKFKIRRDLIINPISKNRKTFYLIINPLTGESLTLNQKNYCILRHFNGRDIISLQQHLANRHKLYLSRKSLENFSDFLLHHYLLEDCLEIYLKRLLPDEKEVIALRLEAWIKEYCAEHKDNFSWLEEMIINQALQAAEEKDIIKAINYFNDLERLNSQNNISSWLPARLEEEIVRVSHGNRGIKTKNLTFLKPAVVKLGILLTVTILTAKVFFNLFSLPQYSKKTLLIIKATGEELVQNKNLALTAMHRAGDNLQDNKTSPH